MESTSIFETKLRGADDVRVKIHTSREKVTTLGFDFFPGDSFDAEVSGANKEGTFIGVDAADPVGYVYWPSEEECGVTKYSRDELKALRPRLKSRIPVVSLPFVQWWETYRRNPVAIDMSRDACSKFDFFHGDTVRDVSLNKKALVTVLGVGVAPPCFSNTLFLQPEGTTLAHGRSREQVPKFIELVERAPDTMHTHAAKVDIVDGKVEVSMGLGPIFGGILTNAQYTDCTVLAGPERVAIPAHRAILAAASPLFRELLSCGGTGAIIELPNLSPDVTRHILNILYSGTAKAKSIDRSLLADLILACDDVQLEFPKKVLLRSAFQSRDTVGAIFSRLTALKMKGAQTLVEECRRFFEVEEANFALLSKPEVVRDVSADMMHSILASDRIPASEAEVLKIAIAWANCQKERDPSVDLATLFEPLRDCIKYDKLSFAQVRSEIQPAGIFNDADLVKVYLKAGAVEDDSPRNFTMEGMLHVLRGEGTPYAEDAVRSMNPSWNYGNSPDILDFQADKNIRMWGLGLYCGTGDYTITGMQIRQGGSPIASVEDRRFTTTFNRIEKVYFKKPLRLVAGQRYTIYAMINGPRSPCLQSGRRKITAHGVRFEFMNSGISGNNGTDAESGQYPVLFFKL